MSNKLPEGAMTSFEEFEDVLKQKGVVYNIYTDVTEEVRVMKVFRDFDGNIKGVPTRVMGPEVFEPNIDYIRKSINAGGRYNSEIIDDFYFSNYFHAYAHFMKIKIMLNGVVSSFSYFK